MVLRCMEMLKKSVALPGAHGVKCVFLPLSAAQSTINDHIHTKFYQNWMKTPEEKLLTRLHVVYA